MTRAKTERVRQTGGLQCCGNEQHEKTDACEHILVVTQNIITRVICVL